MRTAFAMAVLLVSASFAARGQEAANTEPRVESNVVYGMYSGLALPSLRATARTAWRQSPL
jgi:hypothetical protein